MAEFNELTKIWKDVHIFSRNVYFGKTTEETSHTQKDYRTRDAFINNDNFDQEEALEAAIDKRKCLLQMHMKIWQ
jgi:hypothetical protein